jgi:hypothetical protein
MGRLSDANSNYCRLKITLVHAQWSRTIQPAAAEIVTSCFALKPFVFKHHRYNWFLISVDRYRRCMNLALVNSSQKTTYRQVVESVLNKSRPAQIYSKTKQTAHRRSERGYVASHRFMAHYLPD